MDNEILVTVQGVFKRPGEGDHYFVILRSQSPNLRMPMFVGQNEARIISYAKDGLPRERPLTFDTFADTITATGFSVVKVLIHLPTEETFYATITITKDEIEREIDARPSDAIALALTANAPIFVSEQTLMKCGSAG